MKKILKRILSRVIDLLFYGCIVGVVWVFCQVFLLASFKIPTDSMAPGLTGGDQVLVLKPVLGARLFNLFATLREEQVTVRRLPGVRKAKRNDVLVFNFPHPNGWDKIEMHIMKYYVKRCVGLPGDTLSVVNGFYRVNGTDEPPGYLPSQREVSRRDAGTFEPGVFHTFPYDSVMDWNIKDFGPFYIPEKGAVVPMNRENYALYKKVIEWEQQRELTLTDDSTVLLGAEPVSAYRFLKNYYFMAGDRVADSQDSRYWGLLPEEYIVGKAWIVWRSTDPYTGKFRWNRFLKGIE